MRGHGGNCEQLLSELSNYLDGDLRGEARRRIEEHLRDCVPCLEFTDSLRRIIELCRKFEPGVRPRPLAPRARAELLRAWRKALAGSCGAERQRSS